MWTPPVGFVDMLTDAAAAPPNPNQTEPLEVPEVGTVLAVRPVPASAAALAASVNPEGDDQDRHAHLTAFLSDHLPDGGYERLLLDMLDGEVPDDALSRVVRALVTWGTNRPYTAVVNLAYQTGHQWRALSARMAANGVADPMRLPSLHALLNHVEWIVMEGFQTGDKAKDERAREEFFAKLYAPEPTISKDGKVKLTPPAWFGDPAKAAAEFDAFASSMGGGAVRRRKAAR